MPGFDFLDFRNRQAAGDGDIFNRISKMFPVSPDNGSSFEIAVKTASGSAKSVAVVIMPPNVEVGRSENSIQAAAEIETGCRKARRGGIRDAVTLETARGVSAIWRLAALRSSVPATGVFRPSLSIAIRRGLVASWQLKTTYS
jgi:hypothetical protein